MNGLPITLTVAALAVGFGAIVGIIVGYRADRRRPRRDVLDLLPPPDVTLWTGEGWTERDGSRFRHPSTQGLLRREAGE